jgi:cytidylate kinase
VSSFVSQVSTISEVRYQLVKQQQKIGKEKGVVMDGRDIGTVVFPNAELKIFMNASAQTRAQRRYDELINRGDTVTFEDVLHNVKERDYIDSHRANSPLKKADDAIEINNSNLTLGEQFTKVMQLVTMTLDDYE